MATLIDRAATGFTAGVVMTAGIVAITGISWTADVAPELGPAPVIVSEPAPPAPPPDPVVPHALARPPEPEPAVRLDLDLAKPRESASLEILTMDGHHEWQILGKGLPAISSDGKTVADLFSHDDAGRGLANFHLRIYRASDGAVIRELPLLEVGELPEVQFDEHWARATRLARPRVKRANALLRRFDPLASLVPATIEYRGRHDGVHYDVDRETVVVRHAATGWTLLQATFPIDQPEPDEEDMCAARRTGNHALYVSTDRNTVVSKVNYLAGPCWCDTATSIYARRLTAIPRNVLQRSR